MKYSIYFFPGIIVIALLFTSSCSNNNPNPNSPAPVTILVTATFTPSTPTNTPTITNTRTLTNTPTPSNTPTLTPTPPYTYLNNWNADTVYDLAVDSSGNVWTVSDSRTYLTVYNSSGGVVTQWGSFTFPTAVALDASNVYIADSASATAATGTIKQFTLGGAAVTQWTIPNTFSIAVDPAGYLYSIDNTNNKIYKYTTSTPTTLTNWTCISPFSISIDPTGSYVYVDTSGTVYKFTNTGSPVTSFSGFITTSENGMKVDAAGNWVKSNWSPNEISKYSPTGILLGSIPITCPTCGGGFSVIPIAVDSSSNLYAVIYDGTGIDKIYTYQSQ